MSGAKLVTTQRLTLNGAKILNFVKTLSFPQIQLFSGASDSNWLPYLDWAGANWNPLKSPPDYNAGFLTKTFGLASKSTNSAPISLTESGHCVGLIGTPQVPRGGGLLLVRSGLGLSAITESSSLVPDSTDEAAKVKVLWACGVSSPAISTTQPTNGTAAYVAAGVTGTIAMTDRYGNKAKFGGVSISPKNVIVKRGLTAFSGADAVPIQFDATQIGKKPLAVLFWRMTVVHAPTNICPIKVVSGFPDVDVSDLYPAFHSVTNVSHGFELYAGDCAIMQLGKNMPVISSGSKNLVMFYGDTTGLSEPQLPWLSYALITTA